MTCSLWVLNIWNICCNIVFECIILSHLRFLNYSCLSLDKYYSYWCLRSLMMSHRCTRKYFNFKSSIAKRFFFCWADLMRSYDYFVLSFFSIYVLSQFAISLRFLWIKSLLTFFCSSKDINHNDYTRFEWLIVNLFLHHALLCFLKWFFNFFNSFSLFDFFFWKTHCQLNRTTCQRE